MATTAVASNADHQGIMYTLMPTKSESLFVKISTNHISATAPIATLNLVKCNVAKACLELFNTSVSYRPPPPTALIATDKT